MTPWRLGRIICIGQPGPLPGSTVTYSVEGDTYKATITDDQRLPSATIESGNPFALTAFVHRNYPDSVRS